MKKILFTVAGLAVIIFLVNIIFFKGSSYEQRKLDESSKAYVDDVVQRIISTWSKEEFLKEASPQLLDYMDTRPTLLNTLFARYSQLGELRKYWGSQGNVRINKTQGGKIVLGTFEADAEFSQGKAHISTKIILLPDDHWKLLVFTIYMPQRRR